MKYFKQDFKINGTFLDFEGAINQVMSYCRNNDVELTKEIKNHKIIYSGESNSNLKTSSISVKPGELDLIDFYKICIRMCTAGKDSYGKYHFDWENNENGYFMQTMLEEILAQNIFIYNDIDKENSQKYVEETRKNFAEEISLLKRICLQLNIKSPTELFKTRNTNNKLRNNFIKKYKNMTGNKDFWANIEKKLDFISMYKHSPINCNKNKANAQFQKTSDVIDDTIHKIFLQSYDNPNLTPMPVSDYLELLTQNSNYTFNHKTNEDER